MRRSVCRLGLDVGLSVGPVEHGFDEMLGFGAGYEDVGRDAEGEAEELLRAGDVLQRFLRGAAAGEGPEGFEIFGGEIVFDVGEQPGAVMMEGVGEERFGVAAGDGGRGFEERVAESHREMRIVRSGHLRSLR